MKKLFVAGLVSLMMFTSCDVLNQLNLQPSNMEIISALRQVLNSSTFKTISKLKKVNDQGVAGLLPEELKPVLGTLNKLGLGNEINKVQGHIQKASGVALKESEGIMKDAISNLSFTDAAAVVMGGKDAATQVLKKAMYASVKKRYSSKLDAELAKTDVGQYWPMAVGAYNMFGSKKIDGKLSDFLAEKAVDGLFMTMGNQEAEIRKDYNSLGSAVVSKVFDYYTKK